ncbi:uncharacterized protein LOC118802881 [Colossoma macropomum]|uniref:uncharacterized protein LOC118802881 n=1 Tax=Colossoma macropomum TaxID=42526 RepID=UPI001863BDF8|nr:uncharacterized protein LOC118802881 [Colossoma macropomum]
MAISKLPLLTTFFLRQQQEQLEKYISETLTYINTVKDFCDTQPKWTLQRESEIKRMKEIKSRAKEFFSSFKGHKPEKKLKEVLKNTLEGLEKLSHFLDAVEKLAVTSPAVFNTSDISFMPKGMSPQSVQSYILTARSVSPLLINFKRDDEAFFLPKLHNLDVLDFQLHKYICITESICSEIKNPSLKLSLNMKGSSQNVIDHLSQLSKIRMDESFRMTFVFNGKAQRFIDTYRERRSRMIQFLSDLERPADLLDKMKKRSSISTVAGSLVSAVGGVLSIIGVIYSPITAGVSLALTLTGTGMGVTSGVMSLVTGVTEFVVNKREVGKANKIFENFMEDVQRVLDCLEQAASSKRPVPHVDEGNMNVVAKKIMKTIKNIVRSADVITDVVTAMKTLKTEKVARTAVNMGLQEANGARSIPSLAADLPDIGQLAKGTPLAMSKTARVRVIAANGLFIGMDIAFIIIEGWSLAKGKKSEASQLIRCRSALWCSEIDAWDKIYDCLCKGKETFQTKLEILQHI